MPPRGILHPDARGGNIIGGGRGHVGPGGRDHGIFHGGQRQPLQRPSKKDRIRMGPIVFDAEHLEHDDNDDYSDDDDMETAYQRPHLGLDLSNLLMPIINFVKFTGRSFSNLFHLLEKQANLLLGRKGHQGSISVTIVIAVSWLAIGLVVYALAQFAILRRMGEDEEEREEEDEQVLRLHQQCLRPPPRPSLQTTPPTPGSPKGQNGAVVAEPVKSIWLPSVGALQLSKSSILKRRESLKRRRKKDWKTKNNEAPAEVNRIRHCGSHIDQETRGWIENGLDRLTKDEKVRKNVLLKWNSFLHQHLMRPYVKDDLEIQFVSLIQSSLPSLFDIDVEMSDKDYLLISVSIEAAFEADLRVNSLQMKASEIRLTVSKLGTRLECKLARNEVAETVHLRQTGPVTFESDLTTLKRLAVAIEEIDRLQESLKVSIGNALKNVDCDLPPFHEICENSTDDDRNGGIFVESPSSFSSQSPSCQSSVEGEDYLHVSVLRASLEDNEEDNCCSFHPYVILEVDHPAQRFQTTQACRRLRKKFSSGGGIGSNSRIDFTWPESTYKFHISREKTRELLVELWESENGNNEVKEDSCCPTGSPCHCLKQGNISPSAVGHRLLGLCLVSVQDLMSTPSQHHLVSLQGRPFLDDTVLNWTINLRFEYVPDVSMVRPTSLAFNNIFHGVHKTLEMKQCLAGRQQPSFITNSSYSQKEESKEGNAVARAAVRDLQTQQSLRLGAPLATKSVLVIRAVQKVASPKFAKTPELVTPGSGCDDDDEREEEKAFDDDELAKKKMNRNLAEASEAQASPAAAAAASTEDNKLKAQPTQVQKRRGFLSTLRDRLYHRKPKNSSSNDPPSSVPSQDLSSCKYFLLCHLKCISCLVKLNFKTFAILYWSCWRINFGSQPTEKRLPYEFLRYKAG